MKATQFDFLVNVKSKMKKSNCVDFLENLNFIGDIEYFFCIFLCRKYHLVNPT